MLENNYDVKDVTEVNKDFVDNTLAVAAGVNESDENLGIMIDAYGAGSFMTATKIKGMICAEVSDERSAYMTRAHNNARMITMGLKLSELLWRKILLKDFWKVTMTVVVTKSVSIC